MAALATFRENPLARDELWYAGAFPGRQLATDQDLLETRFPGHREDLNGDETFPELCRYFMPPHEAQYPAIKRWIETNETRKEFAMQSTATLQTRLAQPGFGTYTQWGGAILGMVLFLFAMAFYIFFAVKLELSSVVSGRVVLLLGGVCYWFFSASSLTPIHAGMIADVHPLIVVLLMSESRWGRVRRGIEEQRGLTRYNLGAFDQFWSAAIADHNGFMTAHGLGAEQMQDLKFKFCGQLEGADAITKGDELFRAMAGQSAEVKASMMKYAVAMKYVNSPAARRFADRYAKLAFKFCLY